ncbi:hypothetical protein Misp06_03672 [Microbulbifer sp. NBRC 101763]|uniref:hypothetical protein n=1 Tax=Microbulbifer sp. NBRC 101763 TaxID=1113820 RepID=UPI0030A50203
MYVEEIKSLLNYFEDSVPDRESNRLLWKFCDEKHRWVKAHGLHSTIRDRTVKAEKQNDRVRLSQYLFEEAVAKMLWNLTRPSTPFDPDSPYWVIKNALILAKELDKSTADVVKIVT